MEEGGSSKGKALPSEEEQDKPLKLRGSPYGEENSKLSIEELRRKVKVFIRKKDFIHLLSSYPMKSEPADFYFHYHIRILQDWVYGKRKNEISETNKIEIEKLLDEAGTDLDPHDFEILAYLPREADRPDYESLKRRVEVGLTTRESSGCTFEAPNEMLELAIKSAIREVSKFFSARPFPKIGISGSGAKEVAKVLTDDKVITRDRCSVVIGISVSQHHSTEEVMQNIAEQIPGFQKTDDIFEVSLDRLLPRNFLLLVDCVDDGPIDLLDLKIPERGFLLLTTPSQNVYEIMELDLEIRMEDHLLPWELFCRNVGPSLVNSSAMIQQMAICLVKECHGHLLAIILLARALKDSTDIGAWEHALHELTSQSSFKKAQGMSKAMVHVLKLVWNQKDTIIKHSIKHYTSKRQRAQRADSLVSDWILNNVVETEAEGKCILEELINSFLLEDVGNGFVQIREETKIVLRQCFIPYLPSLYLRQGRLGLTETPKHEMWTNVKEIDLMYNKLSELPENPKCPILKILRLHNNYDLMEIPQFFFDDMPLLQILDLSYTSIKSLPPSISGLKSLQTFNLRGCALLMELPPQIGALGNLEAFDLEGTEIMCLPEEIGELIRLKCFRVSLCGCANHYQEFKQMDSIIPTVVLPEFSKLEELSIDVNSDSEWWDANVKAILNKLSTSKKLKFLELYLPSVELLQPFRWDSSQLMYPHLSQFRFTVGRHRQRLISRLPFEVEVIFNTWDFSNKWLKYVNGEGIPTEITMALKNVSVFFLDRHWTVKMLSEFGNDNMCNLEVCLLVECHELQTIIDGDYEYPLGVHKKLVFKRLRYLGIHYMRNLQSIWKGPIGEDCLSNLTVLALHTCPNLTTIFRPDLLSNLRWLKELIVEDCCKIKSLVSGESSDLKSSCVLQNLQRISLLDVPELVSISSSIIICPVLTSLIVYNCPKLKSLYAMEVLGFNLKIKGEKEWWDTLKWHESKWCNKTFPLYEELGRGEDLMDQLYERLGRREDLMDPLYEELGSGDNWMIDYMRNLKEAKICGTWKG